MGFDGSFDTNFSADRMEEGHGLLTGCNIGGVLPMIYRRIVWLGPTMCRVKYPDLLPHFVYGQVSARHVWHPVLDKIVGQKNVNQSGRLSNVSVMPCIAKESGMYCVHSCDSQVPGCEDGVIYYSWVELGKMLREDRY